ATSCTASSFCEPAQTFTGTSGAFGAAVAIDGDYAAVSAPSQNPNNRGAVTIYHWSGTTWVVDAQLIPPFGPSSVHFGGSMALKGDLLAIGSPGLEAFMLYRRIAPGNWVFEFEYDYQNPNSSGFGSSIALDGDFVIVGAYGDDIPGVDQCG